MPSLPSLLPATSGQTQGDHLDWTVGQRYTAYGLRFGLRANDPAGLALAIPHLPLGWQAAPSGDTSPVDILYSLRLAPSASSGQAPPSQRKGQHYHLLYCGSALIARTLELPSLLIAFEKHAELLTAFRAQDCLFVHAGVVGWRGRAILMPGRSFSGKTSLVKALVEAGATYYSDEFAVLDQAGRVKPYPVPLSLRSPQGQPGRKTPVESLGGQAGVEPLPVGLVIVTEYKPEAVWRPRRLTPGQALLALMDNTVAAQRDPAHSMPILKQVVSRALALKSKRGEAPDVAPPVLARLAAQKSF